MKNEIKSANEKMKDLERIVSEQVFSLGKERGITFPDNYNPQNAILSAMLTIRQNEDLNSCSQLSIAESLLKMVTMGLDASKKQCYFIPYKKSAQLSISYFGNQTLLRRIEGIFDIIAQPIFEGDVLDYDVKKGIIVNLEHKTKFGNRSNDIIGAYCVINLDKDIFGKEEHIEVMDIEEIKMAWNQGKAKGESPAHLKFPQEMAKKTVINRATKNYINSLIDEKNSDLVRAYSETIAGEYEENIEVENEVKDQDLTILDVQEIETKKEINNVGDVSPEELEKMMSAEDEKIKKAQEKLNSSTSNSIEDLYEI